MGATLMLADPDNSRADCDRFMSFLSPAIPEPRRTKSVDDWEMIEWAYGKSNALRIVFPGNGTMHFQGVKGNQKQRGSTILGNNLDPITIRMIQSVYPPTVRARFEKERKRK